MKCGGQKSNVNTTFDMHALRNFMLLQCVHRYRHDDNTQRNNVVRSSKNTPLFRFRNDPTFIIRYSEKDPRFAINFSIIGINLVKVSKRSQHWVKENIFFFRLF